MLAAAVLGHFEEYIAGALRCVNLNLEGGKAGKGTPIPPAFPIIRLPTFQMSPLRVRIEKMPGLKKRSHFALRSAPFV